MKLIYFLILSAIFTGSSYSASITKSRYENTNTYFIVISGTIEKDDDVKFKNIVSGVSNAIVILDSPGGSLMPGMEIGRYVRTNGFVTAVPDKTLCASSCALIWVAGVKRFAEKNSFIGFHAAYIYKNGVPVESGVANALVGSYLTRLGLSDSTIIFITNAPPEGIARLDSYTADRIGLTYVSVRGQGNNLADRNKVGISERKYSPIDTVRAFYEALSIADGDTAASLVIPEKRGIGPFNQRNMSSFYGAMNERLKINSIRQIDSTSVEVKYTYRYTKTQCNGTALVDTEFFMGNTLIKKIKANC
jgi:hypothetical protein